MEGRARQEPSRRRAGVLDRVRFPLAGRRARLVPSDFPFPLGELERALDIVLSDRLAELENGQTMILSSLNHLAAAIETQATALERIAAAMEKPPDNSLQEALRGVEGRLGAVEGQVAAMRQELAAGLSSLALAAEKAAHPIYAYQHGPTVVLP